MGMSLLDKVLSKKGYPIAWVKTKDGYLKNIIFKNVASLEDQIDILNNKYQSVYFALATYKEFAEATPANPALTGFRTTKNVLAYGSFFTEIDIRPEKDDCYDSPMEAMKELHRFLDMSGLPQPTVVETGGGFHLYWRLIGDATLAQWREWSSKLITVANDLGFKIDRAGTNKPTQVFRPPNTHNRKYTPPFLVTETDQGVPHSTERLIGHLDTYIRNNKLTTATINEPSESDNTSDSPLRDWSEIEKYCKQMTEAPFGNEELWRGMLTISRLCVGERELSHRLSARDEEQYDKSATDKKLDYMDKHSPMPFTCDKFNEINPDICCDCPNRGNIKSPIVLGMSNVFKEPKKIIASELPSIIVDDNDFPVKKKSSKVEIAEYEVLSPDGYSFKLTEYGLIRKKVDEDGNEKNDLLCKQRLYPIGVIVNKDNYKNEVFNYMWRIELERGRVNDFIVPADVFTSTANILSAFFKFGVNVIRSDQFAPFANAMRAFISSARENLPAIPVVTSIGWQDDCFIYGERTVENSGRVRRSILSEESESVITNTICSRGRIEGWREAVKCYEYDKQVLSQSVLATAFGAPLMNFSTINGFMYSLIGESGSGKSTMQAVSASVWGHPYKQLQNAVGTIAGDTLLSVTRWMGIAHNLPVYLEEISNMSDKMSSDLAYLITQGSEKNRMQGIKDGGFKRNEGLTWKTIVVTSSNPSVRDKIGRYKEDSTAETMRMLEVNNIPDIDDPDWYLIADSLSDINSHYGVAGEIYSQELIRRRDTLKDDLRKEINRINSDLKSDSPERFWVQGIATMLMGARIAREAGIFNFSMRVLREFLYELIKEHRTVKTGLSVKSKTLFNDFLNDMLAETLIVTSLPDPRMPVEVVKVPNTKLSIRIDTTTSVTHVSTRALTLYAKSNHISVAQIINNAKQCGYAIDDRAGYRVRLAGGLKSVGDPRAQTRVISFTKGSKEDEQTESTEDGNEMATPQE